MAEIKIEKKKPVWPWIILVLAVIAILIYLFAFSGDDDETNDRQEDRTEQTTEESAETQQVAPNNSTVIAYVSFIKQDPDSMGLDHEITNEALLKLTRATSAIADEIGYDIQKELQKVRKHSEKITSDPFETTHANSIKEAAVILGQILQNIQQEAFPDLKDESDKLKNAATDIETDVLTLDQKGDVKNFFRESADLLEKMNSNAPQN